MKARGYGWAAVLCFALTAIVLAVGKSHSFDNTATDLVSWIPFAACMWFAWKWWRARAR